MDVKESRKINPARVINNVLVSAAKNKLVRNKTAETAIKIFNSSFPFFISSFVYFEINNPAGIPDKATIISRMI